MGRFRSFIAHSPAIAISVLALALSAGGGAYASTHLAPHPQKVSHLPANPVTTSGVSWTSLSLINGWASENGIYGTGNPKVAEQSNVVYLSGSLGQSTPGNPEFAVLPSSFRPEHNLYITVYTNGDTSGTLYIGHDGEMEAYSSVSCGSGDTSACFTSLATISYPVNS